MIHFLTLGNSNTPIVLSSLELALASIQQTLIALGQGRGMEEDNPGIKIGL